MSEQHEMETGAGCDIANSRAGRMVRGQFVIGHARRW
jgi:hypothetical protein